MKTNCAFAAFALFFFACTNNPFLPIETTSTAPIVVITFDDADSTVYVKGFRLMRAMDTTWTATHFFPKSYIDLPSYITLAEEKEMERAGWETGGHGVTHDNLSSLPPDTMTAMVKACYNFLVDSGLDHQSYAYASGMYNDTVQTVVAKYFANIRTSHDYYYLDGVNRKQLGYFAVKGGFTSDDIIARVEDARSMGAPLVIIGFHTILADTAPAISTYFVRESAFQGFIGYLEAQHLQVMNVRNAMKILCGS
jgi:peptidoglycan/xylan/chitin deacetylase (PgdA/CDA1 family)